MKQVTQTQRDGEVHIEEVPAPLLRAGGVLVRTAYSLISAGTERSKVELAQKSLVGKARARPEQVRQVLQTVSQQGVLPTYRKVMNRLDAFQPLGYSCSGSVIAVGEGVSEFRVGDLVACAGGGYANHAEINFVPKNLCVPIPQSGTHAVGLDEAAFTTIGAIAMQGVRQADVRLGESVAVIGLGLLGLLTVQLLKAAGCLVFGIDLNMSRCQLASSLGCDCVATDGEQLLAISLQRTESYGVDAVIITAASSSSEPVALAGKLCRDKGKVVVVGAVGMDVPRQIYYDKELDLRLSRSYGPGRYDPSYEEGGHDYPIGYVRWTERRNMASFLQLVADGKVQLQELMTHCFPIDRASEAYHLITNGEEPYLGVLLEYQKSQFHDHLSFEQVYATTIWIHGTHGHHSHPPSTKPSSTPPLSAAGSVRPVIGVGMIGAGNFAQDTLLPALKVDDRTQLRGIMTASGLSAPSVAKRFGFAYVTSDPMTILNDPQIQAVVIATRHDSHAAFVVEALKAGRSVFVEKPLALNEMQLQAVIESYTMAVQSRQEMAHPILMVGFNRRFAPAVRAVREAFDGVVEPLSLTYRVNAGYLPSSHWLHDPQIGGGRIVGEGCHFVDLLIFLARSEPVEIYAQALPDSGRYHQDNVAIHIRFANGALATLQYLANGDKRVSKERIEIFGGGVTALVDDFQTTTISSHGKTRRIGRRWTAQDKGHRAEIRSFLEAVRRNGPSPIPFEELVRSTLVTFKILESLQKGEPVCFSRP